MGRIVDLLQAFTHLSRMSVCEVESMPCFGYLL